MKNNSKNGINLTKNAINHLKIFKIHLRRAFSAGKPVEFFKY